MIRDANFYTFVKGAIVNKHQRPNAPSFQAYAYDPYIYKWAREVFRKLNTPEFLNIQERVVLESVYNKLAIDPRLAPLNNPNLASNRAEYELSEGFHQQFETDKILAQQTTTPVAGAVAGGSPTTQTPRSGSIPRVPISAGSGTTIPQTGKVMLEEKPETMASETESTTHQSTQTQKKDAPQPNTVKSVRPRRINFSAVQSSVSSGIRKIRGISFPAGIFFKMNSGRIAGGITKGIGRIAGGLGRNIAGPGLTGVANLGGRGLVGAANFIPNLQIAGRGTIVKTSSKKIVMRVVIGFLLISMVVGLIGGTSGGAVPTGGGTSPTSSNGLDYTLPLKDTTVQPTDIKNQVKAAFPGAKLEYWDKIIQSSIAAGWNPALVLSLWIEETGASQTTLIKNGGSEIPVNGNLSKGHLGCAPLEDQTIDESLTCLFKFGAKYTNDQFPQFMAGYSSGPPSSPFSNNPNFPGNIKSWYSNLVPSGPGAITIIQPSSTLPPPVNGDYAGWIKTNFNIDVSLLPTPYPQEAYEVLNLSLSDAPKFNQLIQSKGLTTIHPTADTGHTTGSDISIKLNPDPAFWKQNFIHELGHRLKGTNQDKAPSCNGMTIELAEWRDRGTLTYYAQFATPANIYSPICYSTHADDATKTDEDFAESVSYYINYSTHEFKYGDGCFVYSYDANPYNRESLPNPNHLVPNHKAYMQCLLGP